MIIETNISEIADKLKTKFYSMDVAMDKAAREIASDLAFANKNRVYTQGESAEGGKIGDYSTKPTLIGASSFVNKGSASKVFGKQKNKANKWVTVKGKHLIVLPGGYKQIRSIEGFPNDKVYLTRTRKMMKELSFAKVKGVWSIGFPFQYNAKLSYRTMIEHFREKYGKIIWGVSASDKINIDKVIQKRTDEAFKK